EIGADRSPPARAGHEGLKAAGFPAGDQRDLVLGQQSDGGDTREVAGAFLDATDVVELGQFRQELGLHIDARGPGIVVDTDRYLDRSRDAFVVIENLIRRQRPIGNRQHHDAIAADVLGVFGKCDARRRGACASAGNQGNTAIDMFSRNSSAVFISSSLKEPLPPVLPKMQIPSTPLSISKSIACRNRFSSISSPSFFVAVGTKVNTRDQNSSAALSALLVAVGIVISTSAAAMDMRHANRRKAS